MKVHKKVYQMPSWMAWVQRPSGLIKMEGSTSTFKEGSFMEVNINT